MLKLEIIALSGVVYKVKSTGPGTDWFLFFQIRRKFDTWPDMPYQSEGLLL